MSECTAWMIAGLVMLLNLVFWGWFLRMMWIAKHSIKWMRSITSGEKLMFYLPDSEAVLRMFNWFKWRFWIFDFDKGMRKFRGVTDDK